MVAAVALTGVFKKMKVAAAQRVTMSLRARQFSLVGYHLDGGICSGVAAAGRYLPAHLPPNRQIQGGWMVIGRSPWAGRRRVA